MKVYKVFDHNFNEVHSGAKQECIESLMLWNNHRSLVIEINKIKPGILDFEWNYPLSIYEFEFEESDDDSELIKTTKIKE